MIFGVYSIHDNKALAFMQPFYAPTEQVALRHFTNATNDPQTAFSRNPEDYTLFFVGTFDDDSGVITPRSPHVNLGLAANFKKE